MELIRLEMYVQLEVARGWSHAVCDTIKGEMQGARGSGCGYGDGGRCRMSAVACEGVSSMEVREQEQEEEEETQRQRAQ